MNFFNFELCDGCLSEKTLYIPNDLKGKIPEDYADFLKEYDKVVTKNGSAPRIKIDGINGDVIVSMITLSRTDRIEKTYPDDYIVLSYDYEFESIFMSIHKEDFGHVYYMSLETWQEFIMDEPNEVQISNMKKHAIKVADSFTEFAQKLYAKD